MAMIITLYYGKYKHQNDMVIIPMPEIKTIFQHLFVPQKDQNTISPKALRMTLHFQAKKDPPKYSGYLLE